MQNRFGMTELQQALQARTSLSSDAEAKLFFEAEALLASRRQRISHNAPRARERRFLSEWIKTSAQWTTAAAQALVLRPSLQVSMVLLMSATIFWLQRMPIEPVLSFTAAAETAEFQKSNDGPALYEAERLAERQALDKEVEDVHRQTSGGA